MDDEVLSESKPRLNAAGINRVFIGSLFVFFSFRINGFDIIPSFIGYLFILSGLSRLSAYSKLFRRAWIFAFVLLFLSFGDIYQVDYGSSALPSWILLGVPIFGLLSLLASIGLYYCITYGIINMAKSAGNEDLSGRGGLIFTCLLIANFVSYVLVVIVSFSAGILNLTAPIILILILSIIIQIGYLVFLRRSYSYLDNARMVSGITDTSRFNHFGRVFAACLLTSAVICSSCLHYINNKYLFNAFSTPYVLKEKAHLDMSHFRKPMTQFFIQESETNSVETYAALRNLVVEDRNLDEISRELMRKLDTMLARAALYYSYYDYNYYGIFWPHDNFGLPELPFPTYKVVLSSEWNVLEFNMHNSSNQITLQGYSIFTLQDDDYRELLDYVRGLAATATEH